MSRGADFLIGHVLEKAPAKKLAGPIAVSHDDVEDVLQRFGTDGKRLHAGITSAAAQLEALRTIGLTGEALVLLVQAKCAAPPKGGHPPSPATVQCVLEALMRLGEYVA